MAAHIDPNALVISIQAITAIQQIFKANTPAAPADHVKILESFEFVNIFDLGSRSGYYAFSKASSPLDETWDGIIKQFLSFIIIICVRASKVFWNAPSPQGILNISGSNLLTDYRILTTLQVDNKSAASVHPCAIQNARAMYSCLKWSISGDLKLALYSQAGNLPTHEGGTCLFAQLTNFTMAEPLQFFHGFVQTDP